MAATCLLIYHRYEGDMLDEQFHGEGVANMQGGHKYEVRLDVIIKKCVFVLKTVRVNIQCTSIVLHLYTLHNGRFSQIIF